MTRWGALAFVLTTTTTALALDQAEIEREVAKKQDELATCYEHAVDRNPDLGKGKIVTRYRVGEDGKVTEAKVTRNDLGDKQLGECIRQVFLTLEYGQQEKATNVTYPLEFE